MKNVIFSVFLCVSHFAFSQDNLQAIITNDDNTISGTINELKDKYTVIPTGINTNLSDVGATFFMNKYIMYSSRKTGAIGAGRDVATGNPYNSLYCMNIDKSGNLSHPYFFASVLDEKGNEGGLTFSPNQKVVYYTNSTPENSTNYQLYKAIFDETCRCSNAWTKKEAVSFNGTNYSIENPCMSADGSKIYFSSNMPGGYGGYDLYVAEIDTNGMPINPKNLGSTINTGNDEKFPFESQHHEIFFSSNGHSGYGGQDVFVSKIRKNSFTAPLNLGKTINSTADEVAFILGSKTKGYFTSNRSNGIGSFDIYRFDLEKNNTLLEGKATEKNTAIALPNTAIRLLDEDGNEVQSGKTDDKGNFQLEVTPLENYTIVAAKEGYKEYQQPVTTSIENKNTQVILEQKEAEVTRTNIKIENIYFDYNKASIKTESTLSLNKIYDVLVANPEMKISIQAHTDARGSATYNQTLSEKRALAALQYLLQKGIHSNRVVAKGFGETILLSNCKENCSEKEYETDRRIEFVIIPE